MSRPNVADLDALLLALFHAGIEFILVGGAAAVVHGAPVTTQDVDIVPRQTPDNLARLHALLEQLDTRYRPVRWDRDISPTLDHLAGKGRLNLITTHGPLDVLLRLHDARGYDDLISHTRQLDDGESKITVIDLETLIEIKQSTGRARDAMVVPILIALRDRTGE